MIFRICVNYKLFPSIIYSINSLDIIHDIIILTIANVIVCQTKKQKEK